MSKTHTGEILEIGEVKKVSDRFQKRRFVVDEVFNGQYGATHNPVPFFLTQEKTGMIDEFQVGQHVTVYFDVKSRPWIKNDVHQLDKNGEKAYFVEIQAWKIESSVQAATEEEPQTDAGHLNPPDDNIDPAGFGDDGPDDMPF